MRDYTREDTRAKYIHATADAWDEYKRATADALAKYERAMAGILDEYKRMSQPPPGRQIPGCPNALLPDGPVCPRCGGRRGPSGIDGGSWVHY